MVSFLSLWQGTAKSLGFKRSQPASGQEESPAKKAKAQAQQQRAARPMPDTQTGLWREPDAALVPHSRAGGAAGGTHPDSRPAQHSYEPQRYQPQQQPQQPQGASSQQEPVAANPSSSSFTHAAYEKARQTLVQMPAGTAAAARSGQHAGAAPHRNLHMPLPRQPAQQQLQAQHSSAGQQQEGLTPFHKKANSFGRGSSPQTYQLTPATGYRVGANSRQAGRYSSLGPPPPPPPLALFPRQQQQQQPRPSYASAAAAAGRRAAEVASTSRPQLGRPAVAAAGAADQQQQQQQQHRAAVGPKPWAAAAAGGAGGGGPLRRSESPPVAQRLFEGIADEQYPAAAAAAVQGMAGRQLAAAPGPPAAAAGIGSSSALTPPANFNAVLQSELQHAGAGAAPRGLVGGSLPALLLQQAAAGQAEALSKKEAELMAKLKASEAKLQRERQKSKQASQHATKLVDKIDSAFRIDQSPDYKPNLAASAAQLEELREQTIAHNQARMQQRVKYQLQLRQQQLATQQLLQQRAAAAAGAAVPGLPPGVGWRPRAAMQQQQQEEEEEDDDVVVVSSGDGEEEPGNEQKQYTDEVSQLSSQEQEEEEEGSEQEVDEAAAGIEALGITVWTTRRSDWSCTQEQLDRFETHTEDPGEDNAAAGVVVVSHARSSLELTQYDLATLRPGEWLNDECMNMYMALLQDRDLAGRGAGGLSCYFFNTFFLAKLYVHEKKYNYKSVKRWTMPARLKAAGMPQECVLKCDRVIMPVHLGNHWTAIMVDVAARRLVFFDSMLGDDTRVMAAVKKWVADEAKDKLQATWDTSGWEEVYPTDIPTQKNGVDCGVFALMFCNRMGVRGAGFDFSQDDIYVNIRARIVCDLLDGRIAATAWRG